MIVGFKLPDIKYDDVLRLSFLPSVLMILTHFCDYVVMWSEL